MPRSDLQTSIGREAVDATSATKDRRNRSTVPPALLESSNVPAAKQAGKSILHARFPTPKSVAQAPSPSAGACYAPDGPRGAIPAHARATKAEGDEAHWRRHIGATQALNAPKGWRPTSAGTSAACSQILAAVLDGAGEVGIVAQVRHEARPRRRRVACRKQRLRCIGNPGKPSKAPPSQQHDQKSPSSLSGRSCLPKRATREACRDAPSRSYLAATNTEGMSGGNPPPSKAVPRVGGRATLEFACTTNPMAVNATTHEERTTARSKLATTASQFS